jgi:hypothetical protein
MEVGSRSNSASLMAGGFIPGKLIWSMLLVMLGRSSCRTRRLNAQNRVGGRDSGSAGACHNMYTNHGWRINVLIWRQLRLCGPHHLLLCMPPNVPAEGRPGGELRAVASKAWEDWKAQRCECRGLRAGVSIGFLAILAMPFWLWRCKSGQQALKHRIG